MEGHVLPGRRSSPTRCWRGIPSACRPSRSTTRSTGCPRPRCSRTGRRSTPASFRFSIKASQRITHMARLKAESATEPLGYLYRNLAALGDKRGPVLFQLPPNLKKDLPRLTAFLDLLPDGSPRRVRISQRHLVRRRRLRRAQGRRRGAVPVRARRQRAAAARRDRAVGLRPAAARDVFRRRSRGMGAQARSDVVARDLRLLHARADGAGVRAQADGARARKRRMSATPRPVTIAVDDDAARLAVCCKRRRTRAPAT